MENEKKVIKVYAEIATKLLDPAFKFSNGGVTKRTLSNFLEALEKEYGTITKERVVDFCVFTAYLHSKKTKYTIQHVFGKSAISKFKKAKHGQKYYEDKWLETEGLNRKYLCNLIADRSKHPHSKYIYLESEEKTKQRALNQDVGYFICQTSTLGWSPRSESCQSCNFSNKCMKKTQLKYPELYRIRLENGSKEQ